MGLPSIDENWWDNSEQAPAVEVAQTIHSHELIKEISDILARALSGTDQEFLYNGCHVRWGLVEQRLHQAARRAMARQIAGYETAYQVMEQELKHAEMTKRATCHPNKPEYCGGYCEDCFGG